METTDVEASSNGARMDLDLFTSRTIVPPHLDGVVGSSEDRAAQGAEQRQAEQQQVRVAAVAQLAGQELAARYQQVMDEDRWDYEAILVRSRYVQATQGRSVPGSKVSDYLVLSETNDPYYVGTPSDWVQAEWIARVYPHLGFTKPAHCRAVHYAIRIRGGFALPDGTPYDAAHGDAAWAFLQVAVAKARYLGLLPWDRIVDNRNPPPKATTQVDERAAALSVRSAGLDAAEEVEAPLLSYSLPGVPLFPQRPEMFTLAHTRGRAHFPEMPGADRLAQYDIDTYRGAQRYAVEVWCEKSTMDDVLLPWCQRRNAQLVTSEGEMTITQAHRAVQRIIQRGKPTVILYVSDFDFKGQQMPVSMARKIQWFLRDARREGRDAPEVVLLPATLTYEQVRRFSLPDEPISDTQKFISKGKRKGEERAQWRKWKAKYGPEQGFVELDAVEGSQEGRLGQLLDEAVAAFYDQRLSVRVVLARQALREHLDQRREDVLAAYAPRLARARDGWNQAKTGANDLLDSAWSQAEGLLRGPLDEARTVLRTAWDEALVVLIPAWKRAGQLTERPHEEARQLLAGAQGKATAQLQAAWGTVAEAVAAVEQELYDEMPNVDDGELAPPLGSEAPQEMLKSALFHSARTMEEQVRVFHAFQGRAAGEESDDEER